jgi:hypothetical protein
LSLEEALPGECPELEPRRGATRVAPRVSAGVNAQDPTGAPKVRHQATLGGSQPKGSARYACGIEICPRGVPYELLGNSIASQASMIVPDRGVGRWHDGGGPVRMDAISNHADIPEGRDVGLIDRSATKFYRRQVRYRPVDIMLEGGENRGYGAASFMKTWTPTIFSDLTGVHIFPNAVLLSNDGTYQACNWFRSIPSTRSNCRDRAE